MVNQESQETESLEEQLRKLLQDRAKKSFMDLYRDLTGICKKGFEDFCEEAGIGKAKKQKVEDVTPEDERFREKHESEGAEPQGDYINAVDEFLDEFGRGINRALYLHRKRPYERKPKTEDEKAKEKEGLEETAKRFGEVATRAGKIILNTIKRNIESIFEEEGVENYESRVPTEEELQTKYQGIGTIYEGKLQKTHYEACLSFLNSGKQKIPAGTRFRDEILNDLKTSASRNASELIDYYADIDEKRRKREIMPPFGNEREKSYLVECLLK